MNRILVPLVIILVNIPYLVRAYLSIITKLKFNRSVHSFIHSFFLLWHAALYCNFFFNYNQSTFLQYDQTLQLAIYTLTLSAADYVHRDVIRKQLFKEYNVHKQTHNTHTHTSLSSSSLLLLLLPAWCRSMKMNHCLKRFVCMHVCVCVFMNRCQVRTPMQSLLTWRVQPTRANNKNGPPGAKR